MSKNSLKITYDKDKVTSIMREIDAIEGFIDKNKEKELKSKYPGFRSLKFLIKNHNDAVNKNKYKKKPYRKKKNKTVPKKYNDEFNKKLNALNHFIHDDEKAKLNPKNNSHYNALIDLHNTAFIKNEQNKISKEFKSDLNKFTTILDENEIEKFKIKYAKDYHDFYTSLEMENSINNFNRKLEKKQIAEVFSILRKKYSSSNSPISKKTVSDLILNYPTIDWDKLIKRYNKQYFNNKYRKTEDGVFYLNDYIRKDDWEYVDLQRADTSKEILKYKDGISRFVKKFTDEILEFIEDFSNYGIDDDIEKIFLVSIPSSTAERNRKSPMKKSIKIIENNYNCAREIINFSDALVRVEDVKTAHISTNDRPKYGDHIRTIRFRNEKGYDFENGVFLVLDDITTTGTIMSACGDILITNNIKKDKIYKLAIAATE